MIFLSELNQNHAHLRKATSCLSKYQAYEIRIHGQRSPHRKSLGTLTFNYVSPQGGIRRRSVDFHSTWGLIPSHLTADGNFNSRSCGLICRQNDIVQPSYTKHNGSWPG